jgi:hypothetical protein
VLVEYDGGNSSRGSLWWQSRQGDREWILASVSSRQTVRLQLHSVCAQLYLWLLPTSIAYELCTQLLQADKSVNTAGRG